MKDNLNDFVMREITKKSDDGTMKITRTRTSSGYAAISVVISNPIKVSFSFNNENGNDGYEQQAFELAKLIDAMASNPCILPEKP